MSRPFLDGHIGDIGMLMVTVSIVSFYDKQGFFHQNLFLLKQKFFRGSWKDAVIEEGGVS